MIQAADITTGATNGTIAVDGTDVAVYGLGSAAYTASSSYDASGAAATAKSEVIGSSDDASTANTIYGAKAYADSLSSNYATAAQGTLADDAVRSVIRSSIRLRKSCVPVFQGRSFFLYPTVTFPVIP